MSGSGWEKSPFGPSGPSDRRLNRWPVRPDVYPVARQTGGLPGDPQALPSIEPGSNETQVIARFKLLKNGRGNIINKSHITKRS